MPAPATTNEFLDLVQKSGLVDQQRLDAYLAGLRTSGRLSPEPARVAGCLVRDGILTFFQTEQLLEGKWRNFSIGHYKVLERLGAGRHASVYLCEHSPFHRAVAVKVLATARNNDAAAVERFYRECRVLASFDHPNIVRAYDMGVVNTLYYIGMEYVDGSSLEAIVEKSGSMDVTRASHYIRQAALGLQYVYQRGVVHRDIKPSDILVDRGGTVKIIDFGLARIVEDNAGIAIRWPEGYVVGTPDYIAPEQAVDPRTADTRADIYSLGGTFYFCLTGRPPVPEGTVAQKLSWHQTRAPARIQRLRPEVPNGLAAIVERMMAKDPAQRPQTPQWVVEALAPYTAEPIAPPPEDEMPRISPAALHDASRR
jgi:serine/threonine protein kinase